MVLTQHWTKAGRLQMNQSNGENVQRILWNIYIPYSVRHKIKPRKIESGCSSEKCINLSTKLYELITIGNQQDATVTIYLLLISSTCFGRCFIPSSGAYHYNYSFWYCPPMLLLSGVAYATPAGSNKGGQLYLQWYAPDDGRKHRPNM